MHYMQSPIEQVTTRSSKSHAFQPLAFAPGPTSARMLLRVGRFTESAGQKPVSGRAPTVLRIPYECKGVDISPEGQKNRASAKLIIFKSYPEKSQGPLLASSP